MWTFVKADSEVRQVVFAKVHKAASSTLQNILLRFAVYRDLNLLLGNSRVHLSDRLSQITNTVPHPEGQGHKFDMLVSHVIYNSSEIDKYFSERAVRIAILREPLRQALSALAFYTSTYPTKELKSGLSKHPNDPINGFIQHPEDFYNFSTIPTMSYINNRMSLDLGFDLYTLEKSKRNQTRIDQFLKTVEENFHLVLISDLFLESMVLMRRYLNWSIKDIVFIKNNVAKFNNTSIWRREIRMNSTIAENFRKWNRVDFNLYAHFKTIFLRKIQRELLFHEEVSAYKNILKQVEHFCSSEAKGKKRLHVSGNRWTEAFTLAKFDCDLMTLEESRFITYMHHIQWKKYKVNRRKKLKRQSVKDEG